MTMNQNQKTNKTLEEIAGHIKSRDHFLLLTHARPDGDTVGSAAAMCRILRRMDKTACLAVNGDLTPKYYAFTGDLTAPPGFAPDCIMALDIADDAALLPQSLKEYTGRCDIAIDHHPSNKLYATHTHIRPSASATGEIVYELMGVLGVAPDRAIWEALYLAIATDTGCFRFSNTTALCHRMAAEAITSGIDFHNINTEFFSKKTKERVSVERALFDHMLISDDGMVAGSYLPRALIQEIGATEDDLDNLSTLIINVEGLNCAVLVTESKNGGAHKASVRTHKPLDASKICARFGGGGHARAAGCTIEGELEEACRRLMAVAGEEYTLATTHI